MNSIENALKLLSFDCFSTWTAFWLFECEIFFCLICNGTGRYRERVVTYNGVQQRKFAYRLEVRR